MTQCKKKRWLINGWTMADGWLKHRSLVSLHVRLSLSQLWGLRALCFCQGPAECKMPTWIPKCDQGRPVGWQTNYRRCGWGQFCLPGSQWGHDDLLPFPPPERRRKYLQAVWDTQSVQACNSWQGNLGNCNGNQSNPTEQVNKSTVNVLDDCLQFSSQETRKHRQTTSCTFLQQSAKKYKKNWWKMPYLKAARCKLTK